MVWIALSHWGLFHIPLDDLVGGLLATGHKPARWAADWHVQGPFE